MPLDSDRASVTFFSLVPFFYLAVLYTLRYRGSLTNCSLHCSQITSSKSTTNHAHVRAVMRRCVNMDFPDCLLLLLSISIFLLFSFFRFYTFLVVGSVL